MHLNRRKGLAQAESFEQLSELERYIRLIINIYSSVEIDRDLWLTEREKDFFVSTVIHVISGYPNPISNEAIQIYKKHFHFQVTKRKIADYLTRVGKKKWLLYDSNNRIVHIPPIFEEINVEQDAIDFKLRYVYEADRSDMDANVAG